MQKQILILLITMITTSLAFSGCYYDIKEQLYPASVTKCDTTNVTYSQTIVPVLQNNGCLTCHSGSAAAGGNISLDNYAGVKTYTANGRFYGSISQSPGYIAMPLGGNKVNSCDLAKVKAWINAGIPNN